MAKPVEETPESSGTTSDTTENETPAGEAPSEPESPTERTMSGGTEQPQGDGITRFSYCPSHIALEDVMSELKDDTKSLEQRFGDLVIEQTKLTGQLTGNGSRTAGPSMSCRRAARTVRPSERRRLKREGPSGSRKQRKERRTARPCKRTSSSTRAW